MPSKSYKVIFYVGDDVSLAKRVDVGRLSLANDQFSIVGKQPISFPLESLKSCEMFRMHGTARMLKIVHAGGTIYVAVTRLCLFRFFVWVNYFATGKLNELLIDRTLGRKIAD